MTETQPEPSPQGDLGAARDSAVGHEMTGEVAHFRHERDADGSIRTIITWPNGRPETVLMQTDMLEAIVNDINDWTRLATLGARALDGLLMGRKPDRVLLHNIRALQERFGIE